MEPILEVFETFINVGFLNYVVVLMFLGVTIFSLIIRR